MVASVAGMGATAAHARARTHVRGRGDPKSEETGDQRQARAGPILTSELMSQNLEMHDRMEHLIEKQISHSNFSTQTWATTENLGG